MARMEIPALYRLDVGSNAWGWHKMLDLIEAVNNLLARSPLDELGAKESAFCHTKPDFMQEVRAQELLKRFGHLNRHKPFCWSNGADMETGKASDVDYTERNLFVPAQWGLNVLAEVKRLIKEKSVRVPKK